MDFSTDIKTNSSDPASDDRQLRNIGITIMALIVGVVMTHFFEQGKSPKHIPTIQESIALPKLQPQKPGRNSTLNIYTIQKGEIIAKIFQQQNLPQTLLMQMLKLPNAGNYLRHLKPSNTLQLTTSATHQFQQLTYDIDLEKYLIVQARHGMLISVVKEKPITKAIRFKSGVIQGSLAKAAEKAGLTPAMTKELQAMFAGQINLSKGSHTGDRFNILYHEYFVDGVQDRPGNIVAAEIVDHNKTYRAVRFTAPNHQSNYYMPDGQGIGSTFLNVPLNYNHISSGFTYHRFDPVLHEFRTHLGIDYAASPGTPVKALGNGHIVFSGWMRGYGNAVVIRYGNIYKTLYGHLEKFAGHFRHGELVKKGEIVGYVGSTGWATGPHLHFELYKNNVPINPKLVHLSSGSSKIPFEYRSAFSADEKKLFSEMTMFEDAETPKK